MGKYMFSRRNFLKLAAATGSASMLAACGGGSDNGGGEAAGKGIVVPVMREAILIQMTFIGAPTLYYGDEAGVVGFTDPDNRRTYPWGHEDRSLIDFYKMAIRLHKKYEPLRTGSIKELGSGYNFISYGRFDDEEQFVIAVNAGEDPLPAEIPVWEIGIPEGSCVEQLIATSANGYNVGNRVLPVENGMIRVHMPAESAMVFREKRKA
jgi:alpha-glucosidase